MSWGHVHLLVNHFPIVGMFLGVGLFLVAAVRRSERGSGPEAREAAGD